MSLRDNCTFPPGMSAEAVKHYQEVIDAIDQIYPDAQQFMVAVIDKTGRSYWDCSNVIWAIGMVENFKLCQTASMVQHIRVEGNRGDIPQ